MTGWEMTDFLTTLAIALVVLIPAFQAIAALWHRQAASALMWSSLTAFAVAVDLRLFSLADAWEDAAGLGSITAWNRFDWYVYAGPTIVGLVLTVAAATVYVLERTKPNRIKAAKRRQAAEAQARYSQA